MDDDVIVWSDQSKQTLSLCSFEHSMVYSKERRLAQCASSGIIAGRNQSLHRDSGRTRHKPDSRAPESDNEMILQESWFKKKWIFLSLTNKRTLILHITLCIKWKGVNKCWKINKKYLQTKKICINDWTHNSHICSSILWRIKAWLLACTQLKKRKWYSIKFLGKRAW